MTEIIFAIALVFGIWILALLTVLVLMGVVNRYIEVNSEAPEMRETLYFASSQEDLS